ncbi:MAG: hypothetical protein ACXVPK_05755 [Tumebacillaceae bacterium]
MSSFEKTLKNLNERILSYEQIKRDKEALFEQHPEELSYELSIHSLGAQIKKLYKEKQKILTECGFEELDLRLHGHAVDAGTASIETVGKILIKLQQVITKLAAGLTIGARGTVKKSLTQATQLRMAEVYPGSFGFRLLSGDQTELADRSAIANSLESLFDIFSITKATNGNPMTLSENISARSLKEFKKFMDIIAENQLEFDVKWSGQKFGVRDWRGSRANIDTLLHAFREVEKWYTIEECYSGYIIMAAGEEYKFKFRIAETGETFSGSFREELRDEVAKAYDKSLVQCTFEKTIISSPTESNKTQWLMVGLRLNRFEERASVDGRSEKREPFLSESQLETDAEVE